MTKTGNYINKATLFKQLLFTVTSISDGLNFF